MIADLLTLEARRSCLVQIEEFQQQLSMIAHRLISDPLDPLPSATWTHLDIAQDSIISATRHWVN